MSQQLQGLNITAPFKKSPVAWAGVAVCLFVVGREVLRLRARRVEKASTVPLVDVDPVVDETFQAVVDERPGAYMLAPTYRTIPVGSSAQKILDRNGAGLDRFVTISTDEPIRVLDSSDVTDSRGFYVSAEHPWREKVGSNEELWAIRVSAASAIVSVATRPVVRGEG